MSCGAPFQPPWKLAAAALAAAALAMATLTTSALAAAALATTLAVAAAPSKPCEGSISCGALHRDEAMRFIVNEEQAHRAFVYIYVYSDCDDIHQHQ